MSAARPIKIAITAMGGQGGGVLADWIVALAEGSGYIAQSTSVPGVAQRTGSTVYYIEIFPADITGTAKPPVLALMPAPGDVDIVLATELMEAGRALARGFVTKKTKLIASNHRVFAIAEKIGLGDARVSAEAVIAAAEETAGRFIAFDMDAMASEAKTVISSVMFGALAGSGALPFRREVFEETIRKGREASANLAGFTLGFDAARGIAGAKPPAPEEAKAEAAPRVRPLLDAVHREFPGETHAVLKEGLKRVVDFQDVKYGGHYLERLARVLSADKAAGGDRRGWRLTKEAGRYLALAMTYEDAIRVADLKTRASRFDRVRDDVRAAPGQIVTVSEYLHPRVEEIADLMPAPLGALVLRTKWLRGAVHAMIGKGRRVPTTNLRGFLQLWMLSSLKWSRRWSYRYKVEDARVRAWLNLIVETARTNGDLACEIAGLQRLIKGYGETHERGLASYNRIAGALDDVRRAEKPAELLRGLRDSALADDTGAALAKKIAALNADAGLASAPARLQQSPFTPAKARARL